MAFRPVRTDTWAIVFSSYPVSAEFVSVAWLQPVAEKAASIPLKVEGSSAEYCARMTARYLEDFPVGAEAEFGSVVVDETEVRAFAERYDPQPFHTDPAAAKRSPYGGLIASGWHTASMVMRLVVDHFIDAQTSLGSPGLGPIHWKLPVRPGDTLRVRARITENRRSASKPDRGTVTFTCDVLNQRDEIVMTIEHWVGIMRARLHADAAASPPRGEHHGQRA